MSIVRTLVFHLMPSIVLYVLNSAQSIFVFDFLEKLYFIKYGV